MTATRVLDAFPMRRQAGMPTQSVILGIVRETPGLVLSEVCTRACLGWSALYHHVARLEEGGFIYIEQDGRRRRLYPSGEHPTPPPRVSPSSVLGGPRGLRARIIASNILKEQGIDVATLCKRVNMPQSSTYHTLGRLVEAGLVRKQGTWNAKLFPAPNLVRFLPPFYVKWIKARSGDFSNENGE